MDVTYAFVPAGSSVDATPGRVVLDVGNGFCPGVLDHHAPGTPGSCTARLVLDYPDFVLSQRRAGRPTALVTHQYPDLDAITAVYFARGLLLATMPDGAAHAWADYVCGVDRGETRLDPERPLTPYSVLMMRLSRLGIDDDDAEAASRRRLEVGMSVIDALLARLRQGFALEDSKLLNGLPELADDMAAVLRDRACYLRDLRRAESVVCRLPRATGEGCARVPGIWIDRPESELFKAWARGDRRDDARPTGYVFTGVQVAPDRTILSVDPDSGVTLRGLGDLLEQAETEKRTRLGCPRTGPNRSGYDTPDPWYDGRSPLHGYTIVDAPMAGTVLSPPEIRAVFDCYAEVSR